MKYTLIIGVLSISFASIECMEKPLLQNDDTPPAYAIAPAADNLSATSNPGVRVPQPVETYMTYQEWWVKNRVPTDIQSKSVREQKEWAVKKDIDSNANRAKEQEKVVEQARCNGYIRGSFLTALLCVVLHS